MKRIISAVLCLCAIFLCTQTMHAKELPVSVADIQKVSAWSQNSYPAAEGESTDPEHIAYTANFLNSLVLTPDDTDLNGRGGSASNITVTYKDGTYDRYTLFGGMYIFIDRQYTLNREQVDEFQKLAYVLNCEMGYQLAPYLELSAADCGEMEIEYICGKGDTESRLIWMVRDYNYTTYDENEMEELIALLSGMRCVPSGSFIKGECTGGCMKIHMGKTGKTVHLDMYGTGVCQVEGELYRIYTADYNKLTERIYTFKTKNDIKLYLGGERLKFYVSPRLINNRTLAPVRVICEAIDADVSWNEEEKTVEVKKGDRVVKFSMGENCMIENRKEKKLDVGGRIIENRAMVPVRALLEAFGYTVDWKDNSVFIR